MKDTDSFAIYQTRVRFILIPTLKPISIPTLSHPRVGLPTRDIHS